MKVVFDTDISLDFADIEILRRENTESGEFIIKGQVGYFDSFDEIHKMIDGEFNNVSWWENGNEMFDDVDAMITLSNN